MDHKVKGRDIEFPGPDGYQAIRERLKSAVQQTFKTYESLYKSLSRTDTSSSATGSRNRLSSLVGGSSTQLSGPATTSSQQLTTTTASTTVTAGPPGAQPTYTLTHLAAAPGSGGPGYGMAMPMMRTASQAQQFMPPQMPAGTALPALGSISNFGAMSPEETFYFNSGFDQSPAWSANNVQFGLQSHMPQDFQVPDFKFYDNTQSFGQGQPDGL
jgi:hypothetical protein